MSGEEVHFWHFGPAHSPGNGMVYLSCAKVAHVGDLYHGFETLSMPSDAEDMLLAFAGIAARCRSSRRSSRATPPRPRSRSSSATDACTVRCSPHVCDRTAKGATLESDSERRTSRAVQVRVQGKSGAGADVARGHAWRADGESGG